MEAKLDTSAVSKEIEDKRLDIICEEAKKIGLKAIIKNETVEVSGNKEKAKRLIRKYGGDEIIIKQIKKK